LAVALAFAASAPLGGAGCAKQVEATAPTVAPVLKPIFFETGSDAITPEQKIVNANAGKFLNRSDWWVLVVGMADSVGDPTTNAKLALERAEAVAAELRKVAPVSPPARIRAYSIGEQLSTGGSTVTERKVEFVFYQNDGRTPEQVISDSRTIADDLTKKAVN
jgi:outer membrane protein OmpA-like peptidoglycan-associated protein